MPSARSGPPEDRTARLALSRPRLEDSAELHAIQSDPAVWTHFPSLRPTDPDQTVRLIREWGEGWARDGLGCWIARAADAPAIIGSGGCRLVGGIVWNLGYRLSPAAQGRGFATELARRAIERAHAALPAVPVIAYMVEHNRASAAVAERIGLELVHRGPEPDAVDPRIHRLVYADRDLTEEALTIALR